MNKAKRILVYFLFIFLFSCSGFQYNKIKLIDYSDPKKDDLKNLDISYQDERCCVIIRGRNYDSDLHSYLKNKEIKKNVENNSKCIIKMQSVRKSTFCPITNLISPLTFAILPYYCRFKYEAHASLHAQDENQTQNNINNQQNNQTQDESNQKYKTLKTYKLEDRVDEVWSFFYVLLLPIWEPKSPEYAKSQTYTRISEAITRQVLNDAKNFKECYKNEEDYYKYQKEKEEIENKGTSH